MSVTAKPAMAMKDDRDGLTMLWKRIGFVLKDRLVWVPASSVAFGVISGILTMWWWGWFAG
jgi:hypothetical protein